MMCRALANLLPGGLICNSTVLAAWLTVFAALPALAVGNGPDGETGQGFRAGFIS